MKAIRVQQFGGPEVLKLEEIPTPEPKANEVLIRVKAAGVNPVETYIRSGAYAALPPLPYTPGKDASGIVEKIGAEVQNVKVGNRVYVSNTLTGAYAEFALCEAGDLHFLPDNISFSQGAALRTPYATAFRALFQRAKAQRGETVLIHGASGGVGVAATQFAKAAGLKIIGTAGTETGRKLVLENGADHVLDHTSPGYLEKIKELTNNRGVDVILEMLANKNLGNDLTLLAKNGRVVVIGSRGPVEIDPRETMLREAAILGLILGNATSAECADIYSGIDAGLRNGSLNPIVGKELPIADAPKAHEAVMQPGALGKIVLIP